MVLGLLRFCKLPRHLSRRTRQDDRSSGCISYVLPPSQTILLLTGPITEKTHGDIFLPLFITVDPARDLPHRIGRYLEDFHPSFVGLYGDYEETKAVCKKYRVYFSTPPNSDPNGDYLVDHSIFVYLMDPNGEFVEAFGQSTTVEDVVNKIDESIKEWERETGRKV